jgi:hypothetical protein
MHPLKLIGKPEHVTPWILSRVQRSPLGHGGKHSSGSKTGESKGVCSLIDQLESTLNLQFELKCVIFDAEVGGPDLK